MNENLNKNNSDKKGSLFSKNKNIVSTVCCPTSDLFTKKKAKPICYIKGDTAFLAEITEESFIAKNGNYTYYEASNSLASGVEIKKCVSDIQVVPSGLSSRGSNGNKNNDQSERIDLMTINSRATNIPSSMINKQVYSNNKFNQMNNISQFEGPAVSCWESKSEGKDENDGNGFHLKRMKTHHMLPEIFDHGAKYENKNNIYIYSWSKFHPFSFLTGVAKVERNKNGLLNYPSPVFIDTVEWQKKPDLSKSGILWGMVVNDKEGLVLVDKEIAKKFKGLIGDMIKQILKAAFGTPVSLKVQMFEPKSTLHRITDYWSFAPEFLTKAASLENPVERMKHVIAFAVSGFYIPTKQLKPFNPLIGETFQGEFENGGKIYVEHISHYPTVARFLLIDENFKFYGHFEFSTETERFGSRIKVHQKGALTVEFPKIREKIVYNMPTIKLLNAASEEGRSAIWINTILFSDVKNNIKAVLKFSTNSNYIHGFEGYIIENYFNVKTLYDHAKELETAHDQKLEYDQRKNKSKIFSRISGSWLKNLKFDEKEELWNIDKNIPSWIRPLTNVLPSDGRFREDLIWLYRMFNAKNDNERKMFMDFSQGWKITIEITQRAEREIRKKYRPKIVKK